MSNPTFSIKVGSTTLPSPTSCKVSDELIWSENTGRTLTKNNSGQYDAKMSGDCIAQKNTFDIGWEMLTESQFNRIRNNLGAGFFTVTVTVGTTTYSNVSVYRSTLESETLGIFGGELYYKSVTVELIER